MYQRILVAVVWLCACSITWSQDAPPQLSIDRTAGIARIRVLGDSNRDYSIFGKDLFSSKWDFLATMSMTNTLASWFDSQSAQMDARLYRAVKLDAGTTPQFADDFRLVDHQGVSRSLYYLENDTTVKGVVLIFTGNSCSNVASMIPTIKALRNQFAPQGMVFWMVDANSADNRSNIVTEANALGIDMPILHDRAQLVANAFHASTTPEVVCIDKIGWPIFYRGTIDDRIGSGTNSTTQYYLANALADFVAGRTVSPRETHTNGCAITLTSIPTPSYSTDIAPLLQDKCAGCHSPANFAPFAMTNYSSVFSKAGKMRVEVLAGRMPPWHADYNYQSFTNDSSLSSDQQAMLVRWIDAGAPRGSGGDPLTNPPPPMDYPNTWPTSLGTPSNIIAIGSQPIPATGVIPYQYVNYTYTGPDVWLKAAVVLPGTLPVVHHILAYHQGVDSTVQSFLTGYVPGSYLGAFPPGTGKLLTNGTVLQFQLHYVARGFVTNDNSLLGLYTTPAPPTYPLVQTSSHFDSFVVPTNRAEYQSMSTNVLTRNVRLYEFSPHLHARGKWFKYEAIYPAGHVPASEVLLSVPFYEFNWQTAYRLVQPKDLPANTKIVCTAGWDNSVQNSALMQLYNERSGSNPNYAKYSPTYINHPEYPPPYNTGITFDQQTWDEMFIGYFNYAILP